MSVVPLIEPAIESDPFDVVTVQSPVCAAGFDNVLATTTCFDVMFASVIVVDNADTPVFDTTMTPALEDESTSQFVPLS